MAEGKRTCSTCHHGEPAVEFYATGSECKGCKRTRSRRNRAAQARKIAAFERFVDVLIVLADQAGQRPADRRNDRATAEVA